MTTPLSIQINKLRKDIAIQQNTSSLPSTLDLCILLLETNPSEAYEIIEKTISELIFDYSNIDYVSALYTKAIVLYGIHKYKESKMILEELRTNCTASALNIDQRMFYVYWIGCEINFNKKNELQNELEYLLNDFIKEKEFHKALICLNFLTAYYLGENNQKAVEYSIQGLKIANNNKIHLLSVLFSGKLFYILKTIGDDENALKYYDEYFKIAYELGLTNRILLSSRLAVESAEKINNQEKLNYYAEKGIELALQENTITSKSVTVDLYIKLEKFKEAIEIADQIESNLDQAPKNIVAHMIYYNLAKAYNKLEKYEKSISILEELIVLYKDQMTKMNISKSYEVLSDSYFKLNKFEKAFVALKNQHLYEKNQYQDDKTKAIAEMQTKYETEKKEAQLKELKIDQLNSELKALKSQMNPHFIFNVMSTVDSLIEVGEQEKARKSLRMFSKMMRNTLEQSNEDTILLEDEISLLESYITLEKLLLGDEFNFEIDIDDEIDTSYDTIPAILLQPIVENAIKHGLKHKLGKKDLKISFKLMNEALQIEIDDNGIGRIASAKINESRKNHQSFATKSIEDRIQILNEQNQFKINIEIIDKLDATNNSLGTKVVMSFTK